MNKILSAIYARKSSESEDRQIQSKEDQIRILSELAKREGLPVPKIIQESKSAKTPYVREGFNELESLVMSGKINTLLVWKIDRLSRNPIETGKIQYWLQEKKLLKIITPERTYLPEDNALLMAVEGGMSNQYSRDLSTNVKRGKTSKAEKGWLPTVPPIGYLNSKKGEKGNEVIIVDQLAFPIIRKMWDYMLTGNYTIPQIHKIATKEWGLRTPKRKNLGGRVMCISHMYKIFNNIFYTGNFIYGGKQYTGNHIKMITLEEYDRVQVIMGKRGKPRAKTHAFAFTGMMTCEECGASVTATEKTKLIKTTGEVKTFTYYHCTKRKINTSCKSKAITGPEIEKAVIQKLDEYAIHPEFYELGLEILKEMHSKETSEAQTIYQNQLNNKVDLQKKIDNATQFLLNGTISEEEYKKNKTVLEAELQKQTVKVSELEVRAKNFTQLTENAFHFLKYAKEAFINGDLQTKKEILSALGWNHRLNNRNLLIDMHSWLNVLKTGQNLLLPQLNALELNKNPDGIRLISDFKEENSRLRNGRDSNPRRV